MYQKFSQRAGRTFTFADDIIIYRTGLDRQEMIKDIQGTLHIILHLCRESHS
uniref:Reverse transcriptase domain-containing protein n=1 Tax=Arion vulgaris TaxID=1028688 RepID=A0A0B6XVE9_9EUPU